ncbi:outer membrane beta-barrel protein [Thiomicrorhabdus indica]|uniref:outer membrane beta-barrel protein n=1 Tax=Thiomicrorhabdus indica TaxID=2267253 RepID=UPI002AA6B891|nr:outer membrane beta-barrel protein [Thiomicrorhabdus indica]
MKNFPQLSAILILSVISTTPAHSDDWSGHLSGFLGNKQIKQKGWANDDVHGSIGLVSDFKHKDWPVSIAADLFATGNEENINNQDINTYSAQAHLGVRKVFDFPECRIHPYIGAGATFMQVIQEDKTGSKTVKQEKNDIGSWVGAGSYINITETITAGIDIRYLNSSVKFNDEKIDFSGVMTGLTVGYQW